MNKVNAGLGYTNTYFTISDFANTKIRVLLIDTEGRRWRGLIKMDGERVVLSLKDGRVISLQKTEIAIIGDPTTP